MPLFCFHGYGESGDSFLCLEDPLGKDYRLICLDFPLHGATSWDGEVFLPLDLQQILLRIIGSPDKKFSLLGYSMGGRIALQLLLLMPEKIDRLVLIAPDGFHKNIWYRLSTQTTAGNKLFKLTVSHPGWLFSLLHIAGKINFVNKSILKIARHYLEEEKERMLLYRRWTTMRKFNPPLPAVRTTIAAYQVPVRLLFGRYDRIILSRRSNFLKNDTANIRIQVLEAGHQLLQEKFKAEIARHFYE